ncbi:MAG: restriction endonuclease subunit S [Sulfuricellaceae bacterium]
MLPKGWKRVPLGDCARFLSGNTPSKDRTDFWSGDFPWITAKDMKTLCLTSSGLGLTESGKKAAAIAPPLSVLVLTRGMTLLKDLPVGLAMQEVGFNQDVKALIAKPDVDPWFLAYQLLANKAEILDLVDTAGHGTGRLDTELLKAYEIPIAPMSEQHAAARIIQTWDEAIAATEKLLANSRRQKLAIAKKLFNPHKQDKAGIYEHLVIRQLVDVQYGRSPMEAKKVLGKYPIVGTGGRIGLSGRFLVDQPSVVIGRKGSISTPQFFESHFWPIDTTFYCLPKESCDLKWFYHQLCQIDLSRYNESSGLPSLSRSTVEEISLLVPSLGEQKKIATLLDSLDYETKLVDRQLTLMRTEKTALMSQLLTGKRRVRLPEAPATEAAP